MRVEGILGEPEGRARAHVQAVTGLAIGPAPGTGGLPPAWAVSVSWDGRLRLWDLARPADGTTLSVTRDRRNGLALAPDGRRVALAGEEAFEVCELATGLTRSFALGPGRRASAVAWEETGRLLVARRGESGEAGGLARHDVATDAAESLPELGRDVAAVATDAGGTILAAGAGGVHLGRAGASSVVDPGRTVRAVAFGPSGFAALGDAGGTLSVVDLAGDVARARTVALGSEPLEAIAATRAGFLVAGRAGSLSHVALSGEVLARLEPWPAGAGLTAVAVAPGGRWALVGTVRGPIVRVSLE